MEILWVSGDMEPLGHTIYCLYNVGTYYGH